MKNLKLLLMVMTFMSTINAQSQEKNIPLNIDFDKIIVSPHIEVEFVQGDKAGIVINDITESMEKFQYEIKSGTLQVYLEGAKTTTKHEKVKHEDWEQRIPIYKNTVARITITYENVDTFSIRGEEKIAFSSPMKQDDLTLRIYGESEVSIKEAVLQNLKVTIYGDSNLNIENGAIGKQRITAYGESEISSSNVECNEAKITAYGSGTYQFNVTSKLKVTSYGESEILYKGNPEIKKGIVIGETNISKI